MNRPSFAVRFAGSPLGAMLLFIGYAAIVVGWYQGHFAWWLAVGALAAAFRTLGAIEKMRRYKAWLVEWQMMGQDAPPVRAPVFALVLADLNRRDVPAVDVDFRSGDR